MKDFFIIAGRFISVNTKDEIVAAMNREGDTHRPRINKEDSNLDRTQKASGEYYYPDIA